MSRSRARRSTRARRLALGVGAVCCISVSPAGAQELLGSPEPPQSTEPPAPEAAADPSAPDAALSEALDSEEELAEVTVLATRTAKAPGSVHALSRQTLERYGYDDVHSALQLVPGVYIRQEDGMGLRPNIGIRGALSDRSKKITLLEDGVLFGPAPYSAPAAYYFPLLPRLVQIDVIKGPAAIGYGPQTIGGAINFVTRAIPSGPAAALDAAVGQYGYARLHGYAGTSDGVNGFLIEGIHVRSDGFKELPSGADTGFYRNEWMFKGSHDLAPESTVLHQLAIKATYSEELSNETYLGLSDADFRDSPLRRYPASALDRMRWHHTSVVLTHRIDPTPSFSITTNVYRHDFHRIWRKVNHFRGAALFDVLSNPDTPQNAIYRALLAGEADSTSPSEALYIGPNERDFVSQGIESRFQLEATTGPFTHRIEYGLRLHDDRIDRRHSEEAFLLYGGQLVPEGSPTIVTAFNEAHSDALAFHALDALSWGPLTLTPGLRVELIHSTLKDKISGTLSGNSAQVLLPGLGSYLALADGFGILAGVYRGMSPPPPGSGPQIGPEISVNYEAGVRFQRPRQRAELIGYYNDYSNLTDVCTFSSGCVDDNLDRQFEAGHARIYGLEAFLEHELELGPARFPLSAAYTLTLTEFLESFASDDPIFGDVSKGDEMPYVPRHEGRINAALELDPIGAYVSASYISRMREEAGSAPLDQSLTTDSQLSFDAGLHYQLHDPFSTRFYLQARNLFDDHALASRRPYGARPNPPRWIQIGAKVEF
ncbi:MAG TPA: TonB-dependent receptor [Polyangiaceae bacterium]|nr:TonB-dependent receptor [Polyangiaceae bacterium]